MLLGHELTIKQVGPGEISIHRAYGSKTNVDPERLGRVIDKMLQSPHCRVAGIPLGIQRKAYMQGVLLVCYVTEDLAQTWELSCLGNQLSWHMEGQPDELLDRLGELSGQTNWPINEALVDEIVTELLADADINSIFIPDVIESRMYKKMMTVILNIMQEVFERTRINCLGLEMGAVSSRFLKDSVFIKCQMSDVRVTIVAILIFICTDSVNQ